jgi:hypothetical protein
MRFRRAFQRLGAMWGTTFPVVPQGYRSEQKAMIWVFSWHDDAFSDPNHGLLFSSMFLSTFFMRLLPRAESATFARHNLQQRFGKTEPAFHCHDLKFIPPKRRFWKV